MMQSSENPPTTMNSSITFPIRPPALKLPRSGAAQPSEENWAVKMAEERRRLAEDQEALRAREENLREYEARLRALQDEIDGRRTAPAAASAAPARTAVPFNRAPSRAPFDAESALQTAWEKLHRARELLEAEQTHMRDERIIWHEKEQDMKRRERGITEREARVAERERLIAEATLPSPPTKAEPIAAEQTMSAVTRLTRAPFDMARSVFKGRK